MQRCILSAMKKQFDAFEAALAHLQYILIARRVQASDEPMRLNWKHFDILTFIKDHSPAAPSTKVYGPIVWLF